MSQLCDQVIEVVRVLFPEARIKTEHFVVYRNQKLYVDILLPQFNLAIEVHGRQHNEFVEHFHGDAAGFKAYRRRDSLKEEWAAEQGYRLIVLREHQLPVTEESLLELMYEE